MLLTIASDWLNSFFADFDYSILSLMHNLAASTDYKLSAFWVFISYFGDQGIFWICLAILLFSLSFIPGVQKKLGPHHTSNIRLIGITALLALAIGAIFTNVSIKNVISRPRPYIDVASVYHEWWSLMGGHLNAEYSFPSGHTTATMAFMTTFFIYCDKRYSWTAFLFVIVMGLSRISLVMHYPSDILGGMLVGGLAAILAYLIVSLVRRKIAEKEPKD